MAEYTLNFIDQRPELEVVVEQNTLSVAVPGIQGASGKDAANVLVSATPPVNPNVGDVWVRPNV